MQRRDKHKHGTAGWPAGRVQSGSRLAYRSVLRSLLLFRRLRGTLQVKAHECNEKVVYTRAGCATPTLGCEAASYETNLLPCEFEVGPWNGEWSG